MRIPRFAYVTLLALFGANFIGFFDRQAVAALAPLLKEAWQCSDAQLGLLGTAFEVVYALAPVPIAVLSDRWLRRKVIGLALAVWSGAMALTGSAVSYGMLLLGQTVLGLGEAGYGPSALAWLGDLFPPTHRSRAVGFHEMGVMLGAAASYGVGGALGRALGWRFVFYLAALPGFLLAVLVWFLPEPHRGGAVGGARPPAVPAATVARELLTVPTLIVVYAAGMLISFTTGGLAYWGPSFAVRVHGFDEGEAGLLVGAVAVVAGAAGVLSGGFLADRLLRRNHAGRLLVIGASSVAAFPLALAAFMVPERSLFVALAGLGVYLSTFYAPCMGPLIQQVTCPDLWATANGFYLLVVHVFGYALAPAAVGWLSDRVDDLRLGIGVPLLAGLAGGLVALWGTRFVGRDERAAAARPGCRR